MEIEKILPKNGPSIKEVKKYIDKYLNEIIVIYTIRMWTEYHPLKKFLVPIQEI